MTESSAPRFFRYACGGCVALVALAVLVGGLAALIAVRAARLEPDVVEQQLEQPLPSRFDDRQGANPANLEALARDATRSVELSADVAAARDGRIELDLSAGEFFLAAGRPGEPLRVDAEYDQARYELTRSFDEGPDGWTAKISFGARGSLLRLLGTHDDEPRVRITVPPGVGFTLAGEVSMGKSEIDLTGLLVRDVELELRLGDHQVEWNAPSAEPMGTFAVQAGMGQIRLRGLGWSSPEKVELEHQMGELLVDLDGHWQRDATIRARFKMGPCEIELPRDVHVVLQQATVDMGESRVDPARDRELPADAPTLTLDVRGKMGELSIR